MKYVFGPVPSRRLGQSLGIDPIPFKTCNWNCVYCQLGRTTPLTLERKEFIPPADILNEVQQVIETSSPGKINWITFVGSGEPTLHSKLGQMILQVKKWTDIPVAVITNGSLLYLPEVRDELAAADAVMPTLDAGNSRLYRQINRSAPRFTLDLLVEGMEVFRKMYRGKLWIEVMLLKGINDQADTLQEIAEIMKKLDPDMIHITLPIRPPAESGIQPADLEGIERAANILGLAAPVIAPIISTEGEAISVGNLNETIVSIVTRHPMKEEELICLFSDWPDGVIHQRLIDLSVSKKIKKVDKNGKSYWLVEAANFH
jgi:wyosine [tRNA(Phe)-imidazoG37] synthetase (radical SAM superfamily)